ncbi:sensor domain-containing diguanylate cyclase [Sporosarcina jeotgali]|uniref:Sensor domain-containing diguanylate cyclase n=1 Tax=Sporosarcina jeotgali TaxID=3020056 RepID=A0ABZ0KSZ8_9BACL|nr:diguanylate cyclase [Sporosarcina sp. B2O-1]WOV83084.1 sensor domain-containing diguanylate cyclase [Sporosarcina sp. B2O-1]
MTLLSKRFGYSLFLMLLPWILFFFVHPAPAAAADSQDAADDTIDLGMHYEILQDPTNSITIDELIEGSYNSSFAPSTEKYISFLHTKDTIWLKLNAADSIPNREQLHWLEYNDKIENLNVYVVRKDGSYELYKSGLYNLENQPFAYPSMLFPIDTSDVQEIYLQLNGQLPLTIFTKFYTNNSFLEKVTAYKFYSGSFYGFLLALALYNLFLYFSFRERSYLYYTLYMFSFMLFQGTMNSFDVELFGHIASPWLLTKTLGLSCNLMIVFMVLFGKEFLELKRHLPNSNRLLNVAIGLAVLSTIAVIAGVPQYYTDLFITAMGLVVLIFLWVSGVRLLLKGHKSARFYIVGWSFLLGSMIIQALVMLGFVPLSLAVFEEIPAYSAMFEALILSLALADKITLIMKDNRRTQEELNETLEKKVVERTQELEKIQVELEHLANTDRLTQIPNRILLDHVLENEFSRAQIEHTPLSIILIDIDYFKHVNDTFGHQVGDDVLVEAAQLFKSSVRDSDTVGRWGGEEFLIISPSTTLGEALELSEKIRAVFADFTFNAAGKKTASFGVAFQMPGDTLNSFISRSDKALYAAKENGRNRVEFINIRQDTDF